MSQYFLSHDLVFVVSFVDCCLPRFVATPGICVSEPPPAE